MHQKGLVDGLCPGLLGELTALPHASSLDLRGRGTDKGRGRERDRRGDEKGGRGDRGRTGRTGGEGGKARGVGGQEGRGEGKVRQEI